MKFRRDAGMLNLVRFIFIQGRGLVEDGMNPFVRGLPQKLGG